RTIAPSALLQAAKGTPYMQALLYISHEHLITLVIPAPCLADALARLKDPEQQARLFDLLKSPMAKVAQFGAAEATGTGLLRSGALPARASTGAAHAAYLAADRGWPVVSARPGPIRAVHTEGESEPRPCAGKPMARHPRRGAGPLIRLDDRSGQTNGLGLRPALTLRDVEFDPLALLKAAVAIHHDGSVVHEHVPATVDRDEA